MDLTLAHCEIFALDTSRNRSVAAAAKQLGATGDLTGREWFDLPPAPVQARLPTPDQASKLPHMRVTGTARVQMRCHRVLPHHLTVFVIVSVTAPQPQPDNDGPGKWNHMLFDAGSASVPTPTQKQLARWADIAEAAAASSAPHPGSDMLSLRAVCRRRGTQIRQTCLSEGLEAVPALRTEFAFAVAGDTKINGSTVSEAQHPPSELVAAASVVATRQFLLDFAEHKIATTDLAIAQIAAEMSPTPATPDQRRLHNTPIVESVQALESDMRLIGEALNACSLSSKDAAINAFSGYLGIPERALRCANDLQHLTEALNRQFLVSMFGDISKLVAQPGGHPAPTEANVLPSAPQAEIAHPQHSGPDPLADLANRRHNRDCDWEAFPCDAYVDHNYKQVSLPDRGVCEQLAAFHRGLPAGGNMIEIGCGPNLFPILAAAPHRAQIYVTDLPSVTVNYQKSHSAGTLGEPWDMWLQLLAENDPSYAMSSEEMSATLRDKCAYANVSVFDLPESVYDSSSMHFVAESLSDHYDEFHEAAVRAVRCLRPGGSFAVSFMLGSAGYTYDTMELPAVAVSAYDILSILETEADDLQCMILEGHAYTVREGHTGMLHVSGRRRARSSLQPHHRSRAAA